MSIENWLVRQLDRIKAYELDVSAGREALQKIGTGMLLAGTIGTIVDTDKIDVGSAVAIFFVGLIALAIGLMRPRSSNGD